MPVGAHNRYWAADTTYAKKNNGSYDFYVETTKAIPDDLVSYKCSDQSKSCGALSYTCTFRPVLLGFCSSFDSNNFESFLLLEIVLSWRQCSET